MNTQNRTSKPAHRIPPIDRRMQPSLLRRLYAARKAVIAPMGLRTPSSLLIAGTLATMLLSILLSLSWMQKSDFDYLRTASDAVVFDDLVWSVQHHDMATMQYPQDQLVAINEDALAGSDVTIKTTLPIESLSPFATPTRTEPVVYVLPDFVFERAVITTPWMEPRTFVRGEKLMLTFLPKELANMWGTFDITLKLTTGKTQKSLMGASASPGTSFVSGMVRYQTYSDFKAAQRIGSGKQLADIGRIVLAMFCVLLFIFIDSSAECLALGIFMSLKALGVVASMRWFPDALIPVSLIPSLPPFFLGFADFMQFYFFTQLARLFKPRPIAWVSAGLVFGLVYAWAVQIPPDVGGINWSSEVWRWRNVIIGVGCMVAAIPVAVLCWQDRNYHRTAALLIACSGVVVQIVTPLIIDIPEVKNMLWFKTWYNLFEMHTPYVFALSTFINVSTLEKRVRALSREAVQAEALKHELALGTAVQKNFLRFPRLPSGVNVAFAHEPARFVSGDILFCHHDVDRNVVSTVLCDVTGHGVQAALKASICSATCEYVWNESQIRAQDSTAERFQIFYKRITGYLSKLSDEPELLAMLGCEIALDTGEVTVYRANAVFPILVQKADPNGPWMVTSLVDSNRTLQRFKLQGQAFVLLFSDGFIDGSRTYKSVVNRINQKLIGSHDIHADELKRMILAFEDWPKTDDDRTLCILESA